MPTYLADHVEQNNLQGQLRYTLFVGASSGADTENRWAALDMIERRSPHQVGKNIAKGINEGRIKFFDKHLSMFPVDLVYVCLDPVPIPRSAVFISDTSFRDSTPRIGRATSSTSYALKPPISWRMAASFPVLPLVLLLSFCSWLTRFAMPFLELLDDYRTC